MTPPARPGGSPWFFALETESPAGEITGPNAETTWALIQGVRSLSV